MTDQNQATGSSSSSASPSNTQAAGDSNGGSSHTTQTTATPVRPEAFADSRFDKFWDAKDGLKHGDLASELSRLTAFEAQDNVRRAGLPQNPDAYKLELPNGFQLPEGVQFQFDENDPRLGEARKLAHEAGLDQGTFSRLLGIHAAYELGETQRIKTARKGEIDKLGASGPARVDAVGTWLKSMIGDKGGALLDRLVLASDLEAMEDLVKKFSSQGTAGYSQQHRETPGGTFDEAEYAKLPVGSSARVEYMRKHGKKAA